MNAIRRQMQIVHTEDDREILFTRCFSAPCALVYQAFTQADHLAQWWGPHGFNNPVCELDLRPGGLYRIVMRSPEGTDYPLSGHYLAITENERLVMTCSSVEHPPEWHELLQRLSPVAGPTGQDLQWTISFTADEDGTRLDILSRFASIADRHARMETGMATGWAESLEKLEALLATN